MHFFPKMKQVPLKTSWFMTHFPHKSTNFIGNDAPLDLFFGAISKRIELESCAWSQVKAKMMQINYLFRKLTDDSNGGHFKCCFLAKT